MYNYYNTKVQYTLLKIPVGKKPVSLIWAYKHKLKNKTMKEKNVFNYSFKLNSLLLMLLLLMLNKNGNVFTVSIVNV